MATTLYDTFDIQLTSLFTGKAIITAGGKVQVNVAGTYHKATLYDPDNGYAALANPVTPVRGKIRFAMVQVASPITCDLYGMSPLGHWFVRKSCAPGDPTEIPIDGNARSEVAIVPFAVADCTPGTEKDTGFDFPTGTIIDGHPFVAVTTAAGEGSKTISTGTLTGESGADPDGFIAGVSLTSIANITTKLATTGTLGALLSETTTGAAAVIPVPYVIGATAVSLSYTLTSAATLAEGFFTVPYTLPIAA